MSTLSPSIIAEAAVRLNGIVNKTPVMTSRTLNERAGCEIFLKCENFQRVGAFKFRGAYNAISQLSAADKAVGIITHSSGNHAQGVALAAQLLGVQATIVMPDNSPIIKKEATAGYGAAIVTCKAVDREKVTAALIAEHGCTLIHPYDNDHIIAGQGTAVYELIQEVGELDFVFTPVGGGGLISGSALAVAALSPACRVVGVEPATADDANRSWREGVVQVLDDAPDTIADGLRTRYVGARNFAIMQKYVHDMTTVSEEEIIATMQFLWTRLKIIVEPSAAVALAPLFCGSYAAAKGKRVGVVLSGGNVDIGQVPALWRLAVDDQNAIAPDPSPVTRKPEPPRILVCDGMDEAGLEILRAAGEVDICEDTAQLQANIQRYQAVVVGSQTRLDGVLIGDGLNLRAIGSTTTRLDHIDVMTARRLGVEICYAPGVNAVAIAEHTVGRLLMAAVQFANGRLSGKTVGIVGFGSVGREVALRARAFNMNIIVNQPLLTPELAMEEGVELVGLHDLLRRADFVTLHLPIKAGTTAIIDAPELRLMKPTACLINTGHTDLIIDSALYAALESGAIAGAAVASLPPEAGDGRESERMVRSHPHVIVAPHLNSIIGRQKQEKAIIVATQIRDLLRIRTHDGLSLQLVPVNLVIPHEQIDDKRVARLMDRLEADGILANPPITTFWKGRYVVLDGATRSTAFKRLGYSQLIVQVVPPEQKNFELHTWYHAISDKRPFSTLLAELRRIEGVELTAVSTLAAQDSLRQKSTLCYFLDSDSKATAARVKEGADRLTVMNDLVALYTNWGTVERTLLTTRERLLAQFPELTAVAIFPQFAPEDVFEVATQGKLLPAGLTRFIIPGRILRLNADLERLKKEEPLRAKQRWFHDFLEHKLAQSRLRYYQEPVILLDE